MKEIKPNYSADFFPSQEIFFFFLIGFIKNTLKIVKILLNQQRTEYEGKNWCEFASILPVIYSYQEQDTTKLELLSRTKQKPRSSLPNILSPEYFGAEPLLNSQKSYSNFKYDSVLAPILFLYSILTGLQNDYWQWQDNKVAEETISKKLNTAANYVLKNYKLGLCVIRQWNKSFTHNKEAFSQKWGVSNSNPLASELIEMKANTKYRWESRSWQNKLSKHRKSINYCIERWTQENPVSCL